MIAKVPNEDKQDLKRARLAQDARVRKERALDRHRKKERLKRQKELAQLKRDREEELERSNEHSACLQMEIEEEHSQAAEHYIRYCEAWALDVHGAKMRALELGVARDEWKRKAVEDQQAQKRANRHVQRLKDHHQHKLDMLSAGEVHVGSAESLDWKKLDLDAVKNLSEIMLRDLALMRQNAVEAMRLEKACRYQLSVFQEQYDKVEARLRELEMIRRMYNSDSARVGVFGEVTTQDLRDTSEDLAKQYIQFNTYQSVLKERQETWELAVSRIQRLKIETKNKEGEVTDFIRKIRRKASGLYKEPGKFRAFKDKNIVLMKTVEETIRIAEARNLVLTHEELLLNEHIGKFADTDVYGGVMQRMLTADLKSHIQDEKKQIKAKIIEQNKKMKWINEDLVENAQAGQEIKTKIHHLESIIDITDAHFIKMMSRTIVQQFQDVLQAQEDAVEAARHIESIKLGGAQPEGIEESCAEKIRSKSSHQRTEDEKRWV
ncbi:unnamed protein product, partial [Choristocarpus tenellus]